MDDKIVFGEQKPAITEVTVVEAARIWSGGDGIISLNGRITGLDAFILMLATTDEEIGPFVVNSVCARELCSLLIAEGFGPTRDDGMPPQT